MVWDSLYCLSKASNQHVPVCREVFSVCSSSAYDGCQALTPSPLLSTSHLPAQRAVKANLVELATTKLLLSTESSAPHYKTTKMATCCPFSPLPLMYMWGTQYYGTVGLDKEAFSKLNDSIKIRLRLNFISQAVAIKLLHFSSYHHKKGEKDSLIRKCPTPTFCQGANSLRPTRVVSNSPGNAARASELSKTQNLRRDL